MLEAAALAVSLIGLFVTPIINKSIEAAFKYAEQTNQSNKQLSTNLKNLAKQLEVINKTVHQAQLCFIRKGEGEDILWELKGVIDEADVILDLFEYESLNKPNGISSGFALEFTKGSPSRLEEVVKKLRRLGLRASSFLQNPNNIIQDSAIFHEARETGPSTWDNFFFGYRYQHHRLKGLLKVEQNKVIAIIGHGGMGKTHLARQVFHDDKSKFDVRIWAHVCNKTNEIDLLRALCKSAIDTHGDLILMKVPVDDLSVAALHSKLEGLLKPEKSYLVVLDDVWQHEDDGSGITRSLRDEAWRSVLAMFKGLKNCKVVMTTRDKVCSTTLNAEETIVLDGISTESMSKLLEKYIAKLPHQVVLPQDLAQRIAGKLKGSPRAAVSIVDKLKTATKAQQHTILNELDKKHHIERLYQDHLFTFRHLPPRLQSCLAFCSMFPFEWRFQREQLTKMWVAHGFIDDDTHQKMTSQDVAEGYFEDLVDRSLFKKVTDGGGGYEIHVHIHSMLRRVSRNECLSISNGSSSSEITVPATVRHLSVTASCLAKLKPGPSLEKAKKVAYWSNKKKSDYEFTTVRTLLVFSKSNSAPSSPWSDIREANRTLRKFKGVKVLDLTATGITQLPDRVGELKHLRYLGFPNTVEQPPADENEITKLLLLETVYVSKSQSRVDMEGIAKIGGIGHLEKLQGSLEFHIHNKKDKKGHTMSELEKMNSLSRTLSIKGIRAVATKEEAQEAHLEMKASLQVLKLDWELNQNKNSNADGGKGKGKGNGGTATDDLGVLEGLQPHANLRELHITRYPGKKLPNWLSDPDRRENLTRLYLTSCTELKSSVEELKSSLKEKFPRLKIVIKPKTRLKKKINPPPVPLQPSARPPPPINPPGPAPRRTARMNPPDCPTLHTRRPTTTINPPAEINVVLLLLFILFIWLFYHVGIYAVFLVAGVLVWMFSSS